MTANKVPEQLIKQLRKGNRFLLTSHQNPDGDAIGSELGLARLLRSLGKGATIWNRDPAPTLYAPLPGSERIHVGAEPPAGFPEHFSAAIILECPSLDRTGLEDQLKALPLLNIDHHLGNQLYAPVNWIDTAAPSVGEMVYRLAVDLNLAIDRDTATCLYLTLVTDTGSFRYSNANDRAFDVAADLVRKGARPDQVGEWIYENQPVATIRLLGEMLQTLQLHADGRIATALLTPAMYERAGAGQADAEGLIDTLRSMAGVAAVALLRQLEDGSVKVSLRSRGDLSVEVVARRHGGGGHDNAAGCVLEGTLEEARTRILEDLTAALS